MTNSCRLKAGEKPDREYSDRTKIKCLSIEDTIMAQIGSKRPPVHEMQLLLGLDRLEHLWFS